MAEDKLAPYRQAALEMVAEHEGYKRKRDKLAPQDPKALIKALAMNIGKNVVAYVDVMYPEARKACSSTFRLSLRNSIYNEIMAALEVDEEGKIIAKLQRDAKFRRQWTAAYKAIRKDKK